MNIIEAIKAAYEGKRIRRHEFKSFRIAVQDDEKFKRDYEEVK